MAKSALGRGLQNLMKDRPASPGSEKPSEKPQVTPGMAALLRGGNGEQSSTDNSQAAKNLSAARKRKLIQASMFVADLLLILLVARLALFSHGHFGFFEVTLCVVAVAIGAWLSCLALWIK